MGRGALLTDVLLALLDMPDGGVPGGEVQERLRRAGRTDRPDDLLVALLRLEASGHVTVHRDDGLRFALTDGGRARAYEIGGGRPVHVCLLMADLVGFVSFTAAHGDEAAHDAARQLARSAAWAVGAEGGTVVKALGDGFLAWLPPSADAVAVTTAIADRCRRPDGGRWQLRAACHVGDPIAHGGDVFGADVNLVARLCALAGPDELVVSRPVVGDHGHEVEWLDVRGMADPVAAVRVPIP